MVVAYDGSGFAGFAAQPGQRTVAGVLTEAVERALRQPIELVGAGRTDRGVHAWGQVVSFDTTSARFDAVRLRRSVSQLCAPEIAVRELHEARSDFDARFSAVARTYRYTILAGEVPNPFLARTAWHVREPLDVSLMRLACDPLIGEHDFSSFCRRPRSRPDEPPVSLKRRILRAQWQRLEEDTLVFEVKATAFCHQMVRSLVGTLVDVGRGAIRAGQMTSILAARHRNASGQVAPPWGLCLWQVDYPVDALAAPWGTIRFENTDQPA